MSSGGSERRGRDLTSGPILSGLLAFAMPTLASNILTSLAGAINAVWIGQLLGERAVAATTNANIVMFLVFALTFGLSMAITVLIGQSMGRRDMDGVRRFVGAGVGLFACMGIAIGALGWLLMPAMLRVLATPADVYPLALAYARISFLTLPAMFMLTHISSALRGTGDSMTPLIFALPITLLDTGLNPVLILGLGPFPALGIAGSATAALIAHWSAVMMLVTYVYVRDLPIRLRGAEWAYLRPALETIWLIVKRGVPMGLQMIVVTLGTLVMVGFINRYGTDTVAAYGAANQLWTYVQMPAFAIAAAVSTMAAQSIGADRWDRVDAVMRSGVWLNVLLTGGLVLTFTLADRILLGWFLGDAKSAVEIARHVNLLGGWGLILAGISMVMGGVTRANGAVLGPLLISTIALVPGRVGMALVLMPILGDDGLWLSFATGYVVSAVLTGVYYWWGGWRKVRLLPVAVPEPA